MATTSDRAAVRRKMKRFAAKGRRVNQALTDYREELTAVYVEGRELDPPMTFKEIATIFGITEAAVMQKTARHYQEQAGTANSRTV